MAAVDRKDALALLDDLAERCTDENYHREAGVIWDEVIPFVRSAKLPMCVLVTGVEDVTILEIA